MTRLVAVFTTFFDDVSHHCRGQAQFSDDLLQALILFLQLLELTRLIAV